MKERSLNTKVGDENRESGESAGCMLLLAWITCVVSTILFLLATITTNAGLLIFSSPSLPLLMFTFGGGYGVFISFVGAYMTCSTRYDSAYYSTSILECICWPCVPWPCTPPIKMLKITVLLSQIFFCGFVAFFTIWICIARSASENSTLILSQRWKSLYRSQDGYAILLQNQQEYKCCGYKNDFDWPAQPCGINKDDPSGGVGTKLPGCENALIIANGEIMKQICISNGCIFYI